AGAEQRIDDHVGLVQATGLERDRLRARQLLQLLLRVLTHPLGRPHGMDLDLSARSAQQPRGDDPVPTVVALAADDRDPPSGRTPRDNTGKPFTGTLHQLLAGDLLLVDRPAIQLTALPRLE